jgi:hopanoid biosynthesis associated protein HpnK
VVKFLKQIRLIVNGDDFGASEGVNDAIIRAYQEGVLTSCSLMVTGDAFDQAVELARENRGLAVGIHLVTVVGRSVLDHKEIPDLVDEKGNFSNHPNSAGFKYYFSSRARHQLKKELTAQFEKFHATSLPLSHIDGHLHMHVHPVIFRIALELGEHYGTKRMRVPREELATALEFDRSSRWQKTVYAYLFGALSRYMEGKLKKNGFVFPKRVYGNLQSGRMDERYFAYMIDRFGAETNEIYFHPALDESLSAAEKEQFRSEFDALVSDEVKQKLAERQIRLTNYFGLEAAL